MYVMDLEFDVTFDTMLILHVCINIIVIIIVFFDSTLCALDYNILISTVY